jgi:segregation and condensation protein B
MIEEQDMVMPASQPTGVSVSPALKQIVEALLFASDEPVTLQTLRVVFDDMNGEMPESEKINPTNEELRIVVDALNSEYIEARRAFRIQALAGGYIFSTEKKFATWVGRLLREKARRKLSQTAVETLAIIAYKQPITKSEVEFIRGVNADYIMKTLLEKNLAAIVGRAHSPGRPLLYGTTPEFLKHFGLNEISDLPRPREIEELLGETEREVEKRMLANQQEIEFKDKLQEKLDPNSRAPHIPRKKSKLQEPSHGEKGPTVVEMAAPMLPQVPSSENVINKKLIPGDERPAEPPPQAAAPESVEHVAKILPGPIDRHDDGDVAASSLPEIAEPGALTSSPETSLSYEEPSAIDGLTPEETSSKKGWSRWKTKIQTFFRKLFG